MSKSNPLLRSEAAELRLEALTVSQLGAFAKLGQILEEAQEHSTQKEAAGRRFSRLAFISGAKGTGKSSLVHTMINACSEKDGIGVQHTRYLGTQKEIIAPSDKKPNAQPVTIDDSEMGERVERAQTILSALESIPSLFVSGAARGSIRWLEPFSLDPLPRGANLLGAVLARLEMAINQASQQNRSRYGALDPYGHLDRARHRLTSLRAEAIKAFEGNLDVHAEHLDSDSYAIAATEAEMAKINMRKDLDAVLDSVLYSHAEDEKAEVSSLKGMYVMFIDDLDLCPSKAVEVVKMAHMLSSRRLFYVFLGSIDDLTEMLFFKTQGELKALLGLDDRKAELRAVEADANEIASSLIRKLIPMNQRIEVLDMSVPEGLDYDCQPGIRENGDGGNRRTLEAAVRMLPPFPNDLVESLPRDDIETWQKQTRMFNYYDGFFSIKSQRKKIYDPVGWFQLIDLLDRHAGHSYAEAHEVIYDGANTLSSTPRHIGDAFHSLQDPREVVRSLQDIISASKGSASGNSEKKKLTREIEKWGRKTAEWLWTMFRGHVSEDGPLTIAVQEKLRHCIEKHQVWELTPPGMRVRAVRGDSLVINPFEWRNAHMLSPIDLDLEIGRILRFNLEVQKDKDDWQDSNAKDPEYVALGDRTRPAFKLLHDFLWYSGVGVLSQQLGHEELDQIACARWTFGYKTRLRVPWMYRPWVTFWRRDIFRDLWNHSFEVSRAMSTGTVKLSRTELSACLALSWISATLITLDAQPGDLGMFDCQNHKGKENSKNPALTRGNNLLLTRYFDPKEDDDATAAYRAKTGAKSDKDFWEDEDFSGKLVNNAKKAIQDTIRDALVSLVDRASGGRNDLYTQAMQAKIVEIILLCMPEAGPIMFFAGGIAEERDSPFEAKQFARGFFDVTVFLAEQLALLSDGEMFHSSSSRGEASSGDKQKDVQAVSLQPQIYHDIMRSVREQRLRRIDRFITTYPGAGLLMSSQAVFRGWIVPPKGKDNDPTRKEWISNEGLVFNYGNLKPDIIRVVNLDENVEDQLITMFEHARPGYRSFKSYFDLKRDEFVGTEEERNAIADWLDRQGELVRKAEEKRRAENKKKDEEGQTKARRGARTKRRNPPAPPPASEPSGT